MYAIRSYYGLICTSRGLLRFDARRESSDTSCPSTSTGIKSASISAESVCGITPAKIKIGSSMPASRRRMPSTTSATPKAAAPSLAKIRAQSICPWPYPSDLTSGHQGTFVVVAVHEVGTRSAADSFDCAARDDIEMEVEMWRVIHSGGIT